MSNDKSDGTMRKDVREIANALEAQGFDLVTTAKNHIVVLRAGRFVGTLPSTPRGDRWRVRTIATLRRAGFEWPAHDQKGGER